MVQQLKYSVILKEYFTKINNVIIKEIINLFLLKYQRKKYKLIIKYLNSTRKTVY